MLNGISVDLNKFSFFFWFVLLGVLTVIISISSGTDYVYLGLLLCLYGMVSHLLDHFFDRVFSIIIGKNLNDQNMRELHWGWHSVRLFVMLGLIACLILCANYTYHFV